MKAIAVGVLAAASRPPTAFAYPAGRAGRVPPPSGVLTRLPGDGNLLALTVDDGASVEVVSAFATFCRDSGTRLTFFVNGANSSWSVNAPQLRPMVESGQIQMGNHTWSHPYITKITTAALTDQIQRNKTFLQNTYGVDGTPFFRPPYGVHNDATDKIVADLGYPTITMWSTTIGDSNVENEQQLLGAAQQAFLGQQIVLAHANRPTITHTYPQLLDIIASRNLQTVTLNDVFG
ncbi:MAG: polysaccharide deacetylase family protein [Mycobacteriaceae bacterium]|nr:polysaccharide deacetylase family protein [Mycobacteriaceae bacterium]